MATLVLTAVGTLVGGPIGASIGAIIGQQIDQNILLRPRDRQGPRLQELAVQSSTYGAPIPRIYGRMRVAGSVIWATDLKESREREGGGKGRPGVVTYRYSACFAVALSSRPIRDIGRIWADGNVLRGGAGDFKYETGFRFYRGDGDGVIDPLIEAAEGAGDTPSYRWIAYAVFEDFDLSEFGNRIPSLSFEVIADPAPVPLGAIISDAARGQIAADIGLPVPGYSAAGSSQLAELRDLQSFFALRFTGGAQQAAARLPTLAVDAADTAVNLSTEALALEPPQRTTAALAEVPVYSAARYYDIDRDFLPGTQGYRRTGFGFGEAQKDIAAAFAAGDIFTLLQSDIARAITQREQLRLVLPRSYAALQPGCLLRIASSPLIWCVRDYEFQGSSIEIRCTACRFDMAVDAGARDQGRHVGALDLTQGETHLLLIDLPFDPASPFVETATPQLFAAAAGSTAGWRKAQLFVQAEVGSDALAIGATSGTAIMGQSEAALGAAHPALLDQRRDVVVQLRDPGQNLSNANASRLQQGENLAWIGGEIIQFADAEPLGDGRFRLSGLRRGLAGTEFAMAGHQPAEDFALLRRDELTPIGGDVATPLQPLRIIALGSGDSAPVASAVAAAGQALLPWSPVHGQMARSADGGAIISWVVRASAGQLWLDGVETPQPDATMQHRIDLSDAETGAPLGQFVTGGGSMRIALSAAQLAATVGGRSAIMIAVVQIGKWGQSRPLIWTEQL